MSKRLNELNWSINGWFTKKYIIGATIYSKNDLTSGEDPYTLLDTRYDRVEEVDNAIAMLDKANKLIEEIPSHQRDTYLMKTFK